MRALSALRVSEATFVYLVVFTRENNLCSNLKLYFTRMFKFKVVNGQALNRADLFWVSTFKIGFEVLLFIAFS